MADIRLRSVFREFFLERTRNSWVKYLHEANRAGLYPFTAEGVAYAVQGGVKNFHITEDGFTADLHEVIRPEIRARMQLDVDDWEFISRGPFWGKIKVEWDPEFDEEPSLYIIIDDMEEEMSVEGYSWHSTYRNIYGGSYIYSGPFDVFGDADLSQVVLDDDQSHWEEL